jgi:uncharacterized oxidoreductase
MNLSGQKILITGGASGIGLELARRLAENNWVVIAGRNTDRLARAEAEIPSLTVRRLDVTSESQARETIEWLQNGFGGLDLLVNNAGLLRGYSLTDAGASTKSAEDVEVNLLGVLRMTRLALPLLQTSARGTLVFISSAVALAAVPGFSVYAATKAAVHSLARSLRAELQPSGIRVVEVLPPVVDTGPMGGVDVPKLSPEAVADAIVAGLEGEREEIRVARIRQLAVIARLAPGLADRLVVRAFTPRKGA